MILSITRKGNTVTKTSDDAVKLERVTFKQPFNEAYEIIGCGRKEFENVNKRLCIENALEWVNA